MALGAVQQIVPAGLAPQYATPGATENIVPNTSLFLHVKNANAAACVVTLTDPGRTSAGSAATNPTRSVPANTGDLMIPLPPALTNSAGLIAVAFSVTASVSVALIRGV